MKIFFIALRTCPKFLHWLLLISFGILLLKVLLLDNMPIIFPKAHDIGEMVNDILIANIAGYIFYILSAEIPKVIKIRNRSREVLDWAERAAYNVTGFLQMLYYKNMQHHPDSEEILNIQTVTLDIVRREFALVSPTDFAPMHDGYKDGDIAPQLSWLGAMATQDTWSKQNIKKIWERYPFFDSDLSSFLIQIESSRHSYSMKDVREFTLEFIKKGGTLQNTDLTTWSENYYDCYEIARNLINYCEKFKAVYAIK
ncbi:MAG: hypothetical protein JWN56_1119 [Sphingobacteriales bacterium]|nr:hypothetical protein [Sphingobacteriales bacterium]